MRWPRIWTGQQGATSDAVESRPLHAEPTALSRAAGGRRALLQQRRRPANVGRRGQVRPPPRRPCGIETMKAPISACLIVKNEAINLRACLESIRPYIAELVIVDTGSTDE